MPGIMVCLFREILGFMRKVQRENCRSDTVFSAEKHEKHAEI